jgi:hypothetical protein
MAPAAAPSKNETDDDVFRGVPAMSTTLMIDEPNVRDGSGSWAVERTV